MRPNLGRIFISKEVLFAIEIRPREKKQSIKTKSDLPKRPKEKHIIRTVKQHFIKAVSPTKQPRQEQSQDKPAAEATDITMQTASLSAQRTAAFVRWGASKAKKERQKHAVRERKQEVREETLKSVEVQPPPIQQQMTQAAVSEYREQRQAKNKAHAVQRWRYTSGVQLPERSVEQSQTPPIARKPVDGCKRPDIKERRQ